jgi:hypothetical protein
MLTLLRSRRAYALPLCLMLSGILAGAFVVYITRLKSATSTTTLTVARRQVFYVADAVARAAVEVASAKLSTLAPVDLTASAADQAAFYVSQTATLQAELTANRPKLTPAGYEIHNLAISGLGSRDQQTLRTGPFRGMNAQVQPFTIAVEVSKAGGADAVATMQSSIERATLSMFQFFAFIDGYAFIFNGPGAKYAGRMHANGNMCIGAGSTTYMERLTSAGGVYSLLGSGCRNEKSGGGQPVYVAKAPLTNGASSFPGSADTTNFPQLAPGTAADSPTWLADSRKWAGAVTDRSHGVPVLKAPITGTPRAQKGRNALGALTDNTGTSRFLIDPLLAGEPTDVQQQKIAFKADIRIIDGVWYLRDPARPTELGTPIWSDRPGNTTAGIEERWAEAANNVGQDDLFETATARPKRFSYYRTKANNNAEIDVIDTAKVPVTSYGLLFRETNAGGFAPHTASTVRWVPGFVGTAPAASCAPGTPCWPITKASTPAQLLQATRTGLRSAWDESGVTTGAADCGTVDRKATLGVGMNDGRGSPLFNMLPLNFDVAAFQNALLDTTAGELGHAFSSRARTFNGIVFISATWPGSKDGYGLGASAVDKATFWPPQGAQKDSRAYETTSTTVDKQPDEGDTAGALQFAHSPTTTTAIEFPLTKTEANGKLARPWQMALPKALCSDDATLTGAARRLATYSTTTFSGTGATRAFHAPVCDDYRTKTPTNATQIYANYNAIRVINAAILSKATLPKGLSIVTNLPMFLLGDINSSSVPADRPSQVTASGTSTTAELTAISNWVPFMLGGDTIGVLSNNWSDDEAPWNIPVGMHYGSRAPANTFLHGEFLYGWAEAARNGTGLGCREELSYSMRLHEDWSKDSSYKRNVRGAIFVGWNSVYGMPFSNVHEAASSGAWHDGNGSLKIYGYDLRLDVLSNQPPGAPQFQVAATETFRRN